MRLRVHPRWRTPTSNISTHPYSTLGPMSSVRLVVSAAKRLALVSLRLTTLDASLVNSRLWFHVASSYLHRLQDGRARELIREHSRPDTYRSALHDIPCSYPL
jgi:hypothetical protein